MSGLSLREPYRNLGTSKAKEGADEATDASVWDSFLVRLMTSVEEFDVET